MKSAAKASMVVVLVFIVGFLSGAGALALFQAFRPDGTDGFARQISRQGSRFAREPAGRIERLARELELTPEQREQFEPVLRAGMDQISQLRRKHRPEVRRVLLETRAALCSILDENQCRRFDELSFMMGTDPLFRGVGRCLQEDPDREYRRGRNRKHRMDPVRRDPGHYR